MVNKKNNANMPTPSPWDEIMKPGKATGLDNDTTLDRIKKDDNRHKMVIVVVCAVVVIALVAGVWFITKQAVDRKNAILQENASSVQETPKRIESKVEVDKSSSYVNPAENDDKVGNSAKGDTIGNVKDKSVSIVSENKESVVGFPALKDNINGVGQECKLTKAAENCFVGEGVVGDKPVQFWVFRDAKSSSLLSTTTDPTIVGSGGAALAYTNQYEDNGSKKYNLFIVLKNQTGVMVSTADAKVMDAIVNGADAFQVQQAE